MDLLEFFILNQKCKVADLRSDFSDFNILFCSAVLVVSRSQTSLALLCGKRSETNSDSYSFCQDMFNDLLHYSYS